MMAPLAPNLNHFQILNVYSVGIKNSNSRYFLPRNRLKSNVEFAAASISFKCLKSIYSNSSGKVRRNSKRCNVSSKIQTPELILPDLEEKKKLIEAVKNKLLKSHPNLPLGPNGRDDEEMIFWFLKDRKFDVDATISKLVKTITWRKEFQVDSLTEEMVKTEAKTGKAYLHHSFDVNGRPVVVVAAAKHIPLKDNLVSSEQLCVFLIEKALSELTPENEKILGIFDLRDFASKNTDWNFVKFLIDVFFNYYPKRLGEVLFVDAPFIFQPGWAIMKPLLKSYAKLVRFCSAKEVREEYFTPETVPEAFKK